MTVCGYAVGVGRVAVEVRGSEEKKCPRCAAGVGGYQTGRRELMKRRQSGGSWNLSVALSGTGSPAAM